MRADFSKVLKMQLGP